jgi:hypothetical protein
MQVLMLQTRYGSEDGFVVRRFLQNHQYEIADSLGAYFINLGVSVPPQQVRGDGLYKTLTLNLSQRERGFLF